MAATELFTGALFGSALLVAGVASPAVIVGQLELRDFHMLGTFMTASAASAAIVRASRASSHAALPPRTPQPYSIFTPLDANIVGGLLQGLGMALTGACPGTGLVQLGTGLKSAGEPIGAYLLAGGLLGGWLWNRVEPLLPRRKAAAPPTSGKATTSKGPSEITIFAAYELGLISGLYLITKQAPFGRAPVSPIVGGLLIGAAQATTVLLSRRTVGVSGSYAQAAGWLDSLFSKSAGRAPLNVVQFATGIVAASFAISVVKPDILATAMRGLSIPRSQALIGAAIQILGARLAGGCTSGHGISGMASLGLASFVSVAAMFGGGIAARSLLA